MVENTITGVEPANRADSNGFYVTVEDFPGRIWIPMTVTTASPVIQEYVDNRVATERQLLSLR
jgi:hypothetical protein